MLLRDASGKSAGNRDSSVHDRLRIEFDQVCSVLALCFRQPVRYYEIEYVEILEGRVSTEIKRLPNLRGVSFANRIADACARVKPETSDLWPREIGFTEGMASAARLRNDLFHGSKANDELYAELVRIRTFTERLVLKLLKWPDDRLWVRRDDVLGRINYP